MNRVILSTINIMLLTLILTGCKNGAGKFDAMGTFESDEILISSEIGGKILTLNVIEGDNVTKNLEIGKIDSREIELNRDKLLRKIDSLNIKKPDINKQIAPIRQQLKAAEIEKQRVERLLKVNAANKKDLDDINASISLYNRQLTAQQSTLSQSNKSMDEEVSSLNLDIDILNDKIRKSSIVSNIDGVVLEKYAYSGEITAIGKPILKVANIDRLNLKAFITQDQLTQLKLGDNVKVFVDFGKEYREYDGKIIWISSVAEFTPKTIQTKDERQNLVYAIKITVQNDGYLKIGSYGEIRFTK